MLNKHHESGFALVSALLFASIVMVFVVTGASMVLNSQKQNWTQLVKQGQAQNVAKAGIQDAIGWFKRQDAQPVRQGNDPDYECSDAAFNPLWDDNPLLRDTLHEDQGIVNDIKIDRNIYGRYVIKKQGCDDDYDKHRVHDITSKRGKGSEGDGIVWYIESKGYVYIRNDMSKDEDGRFTTGPEDAPNKILDSALVSVEINRLALLLPLNAPLIVTGGGTLGSKCEIVGDSTTSTGVGYYGTAPSTSSAQINITGVPKTTALTSTVTPESIFSVSEIELKALADNVYTTLTQVPKPLPLSIVFLDGNFTFTTANPLVGTGILYVNGNLTLNQNSFSNYLGFIYVDGNLTINGANQVAGAVIVKGSATVNPTAEKALLEFNSSLIKSVRNKLGLYRENNLTYQVAN